MWTSCVGSQLKAYFYLEVLADGEESLHPGDRETLLAEKIKFTANGKSVDGVVATNAGGEFLIDLQVMGIADSTIVEIVAFDWKRYAKFPTSLCTPVTTVRTTSPALIMNLYTVDRSFSPAGPESPDIVSIARHMLYHKCSLDLISYEIVIQLETLKFFLANPAMRHAIEQGLLKFQVKGDYPAQVLGRNYKWQFIYMNLSLLRHWPESVRLLFWDADEYLVLSPMMRQEFFSKIEEYATVNIQRKSVVCKSCEEAQSRDANAAGYGANIPPPPRPEKEYRFSDNTYVQSDRHLATKVIINPNIAGCMLVHFSLCPNPNIQREKKVKVRLDSRVAYIAHFDNLHRHRITSRDPEYDFYPTELGKVLGVCEPPGSVSWNNTWTIVEAMQIHAGVEALSQWSGGHLVSFYFRNEVVIVAGLILVVVWSAMRGLCVIKRDLRA